MTDFRLDHVVIAVNDLATATADYAALLGRAPSWRGEHPRYGTGNTLFRIDNTYVELLAPGGHGQRDARWAGELARFLQERGEGLYALALGVDDVDAAARELRMRGLEVLDPADGDGVDQMTGARREWCNAQVPVKASQGVRIFFIEHRSPHEALPIATVAAPGEGFVKRLDHVVVLSADMEASRHLWVYVIGVRLAMDRTFPERNTRILFFRPGDVTIEISGGAQQTEEGFGKPDRLWGIAWGVDNVEAACARLRDAGVETSGPRPGIKPGTLVATVKGARTHGVPTLLIEHTPESFRPEARVAVGDTLDNAPERRAFRAKALDHVVLSAIDLDATAAKWRDVLGLHPEPAITPEGTHMKLARLPAGNAFIELVQPLSDDHRIARSIAERGQGMFSISIEVDDLNAAVADLRAKGVTVSDAEPGVWSGTSVARINKASTNGVSIQLIERG